MVDVLDGIDLGDEIDVVEPRRSSPSKILTDPFYFDLETVPDTSREKCFGLDPLPEPVRLAKPKQSIDEVLEGTIPSIKKVLRTAPREWINELVEAEQSRDKPRKGVLDAVAGTFAERESIADAEANRNKKMSVTPEFCQIVAMGFAYGDDEPIAMIAEKPSEEVLILETFWETVYCLRAPIVGFNVLGFDLPVIFVRSALLGVKPSRKIDLKPWGTDVYDLFKKRFPGGGGMRMKDLASYYGIEVPAGDFDGSQVSEAFEAKQFYDIAEYVKSDVMVAQHLHHLWSPFFK
jgi:hypothetical protein